MYEELKNLKEMNGLIRRKQERLDELRSALTSLSAPYDAIHVQTSPEDRLSNLMCKIVIAENELDEMIDDFADRKRKAQMEIHKLPVEAWQDVLYMHYIEMKPMEEIAEIMGITEGAAYAKNNRALKYFKKKLT